MAPKYRQLHAKTLDSFDFNELPDDFARVCWLLLPLIMDSEGRGINNTAWVRSKMFPLRPDVSLEQIQTAFESFNERKMIVTYEVEGRSYFCIPKWKTYQSGTEKEAKSALPACPDLLMTNSGVKEELLEVPALYCIEPVNESGKKEPKKSTATTPYIRIFSDVTGMPSIPGDPSEVFITLDGLMDKYKTENAITEYLKPFYQAWIKTKGKDGRFYSKANNAWLTTYAVAGEMPGGNNNQSKARKVYT